MRKIKGIVKITQVLLALLVLVMAMAFYTNVSTQLTKEDVSVFESLGFKSQSRSLIFQEEVALISRLQAAVFERAPLGDGIELYQAREPADLMRVGHGLCYDRSRAFDKGATFLGFEARHVYVLYRQNKSFLNALTTFGQASHAVTEVKTSRGWMFVDSNTPWVAVTRSGEPVGADDVWRRFDEFENPPPYLKDPYWAIRGMYSRKGHFYAPYVLFPELNWPVFLTWLARG
jgi:hypothetical protein